MSIDRKILDMITLMGNLYQEVQVTKDSEKILDRLARLIVENVGVKGCSVRILNDSLHNLQLLSVMGMSESFEKLLREECLITSPFKQEALKGNPIFIEDMTAATDVPHELTCEGIQAAASIPIKLEEHVYGLLCVYDDKPRPFASDERTYLAAMAVLMAAAINSWRKMRRLETIFELVKSLTLSLDLDGVLKEIVVRATQSMKCKAASIRLLDESTNQVVFKTSYGLSQKYLDKIPPTLDLSPVDRLVMEGNNVVIVDDMQTDPDIIQQNEAREEDLHSMLCAPMTVNDKSIGILKVYYGVPTSFTREEINFLKSLAEVSAIAIMNASLYGKLHSLYQVTSSLSSTLETKRLIDLITIHAADYMQAAGAQILMWDKEYEKFTTQAAYHLGEDFISSLNLDMNSWSARETMEGHTIIVGNLAEDDRLDIRENAMKAGINSLVSIPLKLVGRVMGILQVYCRRPRSFTAEEIEFLTALANHGAVALENAQMHEHFKSEYDRLVDDIYVWHDWTSYIIRE